MTRIKVSENFYLDEFIDPHTYLYEVKNGLDQIDHRLFEMAQLLRDKWAKPISINTWWSYYKENETLLTCDQIIEDIEKMNTIRKWSGLRTERCSIGSAQSAHKQGKAIDCVGSGKDLFAIVKENAKDFYSIGLRRLEDWRITPTWLHLDTLERNTQPNSIRVVDLTKATEIIRW